MKRILLTLTALCGLSLGLQAQSQDTNKVQKVTVNIDTTIGNTRVQVIGDATVIEDGTDMLVNPSYQNEKLITSLEQLLTDIGLNLNDKNKASLDSLATILNIPPSVGEAISNPAIQDLITQNTPTKGKKKKHYGFGARSDIDFYWAFNNWGDKQYNGLLGTEGASAINTSFSSYQLAWNYAIVMVPHWQLKVGLGYESDIYKFQQPEVHLLSTGFALPTDPAIGLTAYNASATKLVTRYVTLPVTIAYRSRDWGRRFTCAVAAIPGLTLSGKHSGMKYQLDNNNNKRVESVSQYMNPFKCDLRLEVGLRKRALFVQVPLMPVFDDVIAEKYYPIKLGFKF